MGFFHVLAVGVWAVQGRGGVFQGELVRAGEWSQGQREKWMDLFSLAKRFEVQGVSQMCWQEEPVVSHHLTGLSPALGQASCGFSLPSRHTGFIIFQPENHH